MTTSYKYPDIFLDIDLNILEQADIMDPFARHYDWRPGFAGIDVASYETRFGGQSAV